MGQKVNPNGLRLGINRDWSSHWYADKKHFSVYLKEDIDIRRYLEKEINRLDAGLSHIDIDRIKNQISVSIYVSHPGMVVGQDGATIKALKAGLLKAVHKKDEEIKLVIVEVKNPDLDAVLVARDICRQIEQRGSIRTIEKKAVSRVMRAGAKGCKVRCSGRINGADIARFEQHRDGVLSLHTLRQPVDYCEMQAHTISGVIGVKVWISLPDNYKELRERKPDDRRSGYRGNRNGRPGNRGNGDRRGYRPAPSARPAQIPNPEKDSDQKGE